VGGRVAEGAVAAQPLQTGEMLRHGSISWVQVGFKFLRQELVQANYMTNTRLGLTQH
jgi:hypothetical protein